MKITDIIIVVLSILLFVSLSFSAFVGRKGKCHPIVSENFLKEERVQYPYSRWEFLQCYYKNDCRTSQWRHKETGEIREAIGMQPPMAKLEISKGGRQ